VRSSPLSTSVSGYALDPNAAEALFGKNEELVGELFLRSDGESRPAIQKRIVRHEDDVQIFSAVGYRLDFSSNLH
jgi:hypothetical protein